MIVAHIGAAGDAPEAVGDETIKSADSTVAVETTAEKNEFLIASVKDKTLTSPEKAAGYAAEVQAAMERAKSKEDEVVDGSAAMERAKSKEDEVVDGSAAMERAKSKEDEVVDGSASDDTGTAESNTDADDNVSTTENESDDVSSDGEDQAEPASIVPLSEYIQTIGASDGDGKTDGAG